MKQSVSVYEDHLPHFLDKPYILGRFNLVAVKNPSSVFSNWHESIEVIYPISGAGFVVCDFKEYRIEKGELFLINSNAIHGLYSDIGMEYYYFIIDSNFAFNNGIDTSSLFLPGIIRDEEAKELFLKTVEGIESKGDLTDARARRDILSFLISLAENYGCDSKSENERNDENFENIKKAIVYIRQNYNKKMTDDELSQVAGMSKYHFIREFKRITTLSPVAFINLLRCNRARALIADGGETVSFAAESTGFENMSYFTKTYKSIMGETPKQSKNKAQS